jgi:putative transposase
LKEEKKIEVIKTSNNKKLIAKCMSINNKNIYKTSKKDINDLIVKNQIELAFIDNPAYGHRRLSTHLDYNKKKVLRIMHKYNLKAPRLWYQKKFTTQSNHDYSLSFDNLIRTNDGMAIDKPNTVWSSDLTYIKYQGKFIYLAIIQDIFSKEIIGFNVSDRHDSDLVLKTIKDALSKSGSNPNIFHSDRGREYLSDICISYLTKNHIKISVSDPGSPWQNSWSESFFSRFKCEFGDFNRFEQLGELVENIYQYINYYNNKRIHTTINMSPIQFKQKVLESVLEKRGT